MEDIKLNVAKSISELRLASGMTQIDLAERLSYSDKAVSKWERGESIPDVSVLVNIAEIFGVTLDYLVSSDHTVKAAASVTVDDEKKKRNRILVTEISMLLVWFIATAVFVILGIISHSTSTHWLSFVYAVPVSAIVWLVFNSVWFDPHVNYFIISILVWSLLCSIYLTVLACGYNIWLLFLVGIPGQIIIMICSRFTKKPGEKFIKLPKSGSDAESD